MAQGIMQGSRLAYVVEKIEGEVERSKAIFVKDKGIKFRMMKEPAGYMVYFPRGHCIRVKSLKMLKHYKLNKEPKIIELQGLQDPNSPLGKMFLSQDPEVRKASYQELQQMVKNLCSVSGNMEIPTKYESPNFADD